MTYTHIPCTCTTVALVLALLPLAGCTEVLNLDVLQPISQYSSLHTETQKTIRSVESATYLLSNKESQGSDVLNQFHLWLIEAPCSVAGNLWSVKFIGLVLQPTPGPAPTINFPPT